MTMSRYHNLDIVESLWSSILFRDAYPECHNSDNEILKVSLVTHSTLRLFKDLRDRELSLAAQLECVTEKLEFEIGGKTALQEELLQLKNELIEVKSIAKKFQHEAKVEASKFERLQSKFAAEVDARLLAMFKNCLQQNKTATVRDMMTQMYQDTQIGETDLTGEAKISLNSKKMETDSPDFIQPTPEDNCKKQSFVKKSKRNKTKTEDSSDPNQSIMISKQTPPSPNEIADTPIRKKDNKKRHEKFRKLLKDETEDSELSVQNKIYAKDTQDIEDCQILKPFGNQNIRIPPTLDNEDVSEEDDVLIQPETTENEKENAKILTDSFHLSRKLADISSESKLSSTPKKEIKVRSNSPILGSSSGKKANSRAQASFVSDTPSPHLAPKKKQEVQIKNSQNKSTVEPCFVDVGYRVTENNKIRRSAQPNLPMMFDKQSKSRSKKLSLRKDISKTDEFNGGQRSSVDLALDVSQISEKQQIEIALRNSIEDKFHDSAADDSDVTLFELNSPLSKEVKVASGGRSFIQQSKKSHCSASIGASSETFFEPGFASTAKEDVFVTKQPNNLLDNDISDNPDLNDLVDALNNLNETAPYPPETSYDRLPKRTPSPNYAYDGGPVRKKSDRRNLKGVECLKCGEFFDAAFDDPNKKHDVVNDCSRHRSKHGLRSRSPKGYWDMGMPPTQVIRERQGLPSS